MDKLILLKYKIISWLVGYQAVVFSSCSSGRLSTTLYNVHKHLGAVPRDSTFSFFHESVSPKYFVWTPLDNTVKILYFFLQVHFKGYAV
jgi:hypothetical protein